jgi:hypothetical protein
MTKKEKKSADELLQTNLFQMCFFKLWRFSKLKKNILVFKTR